MLVLTAQSLQLKDSQESQRHFPHEQTFVPLLPMLKVQDLLDGQVSGPTNLQGGAHRYVVLHHLQRLGSGSLGNPLRYRGLLKTNYTWHIKPLHLDPPPKGNGALRHWRHACADLFPSYQLHPMHLISWHRNRCIHSYLPHAHHHIRY